MITIKINEAEYNLRSNWNEVTFKGYCEIVEAKNKPLLERLAVYSSMPIELISALSLQQLTTVSDVVGYLEDFETVSAFCVGYESDLNIGEQEYWKVEKAKQLLKGKTYPITVAAEIIELYTGDKDGEGGKKVNDLPVTEVIGMASFFLSAFQTSLSGSNG